MVGPRQCGKTTLAREIGASEVHRIGGQVPRRVAVSGCPAGEIMSVELPPRMTKKPSPKKRVARAKPAPTKATALAVPRAKRSIVGGGDMRFAEVIALIEAARRRAYQAVNTELVAHY